MAPLVDRTIPRLATRQERAVRSPFLRAAGLLRSSFPDAAINAAIDTGKLSADGKARIRRWADDLTPTTDAIVKTFHLAGQQTATFLVDQIGTRQRAPKPAVAGRFDVTNPAAVAWAKAHAGDLITGIVTEAEQAIIQAIKIWTEFTMAGAMSRYQLQQMIRASGLGLALPQTVAVANYQQALLKAGMDAAEAARLTQRYADRLLNYRAKVIARHETILAANAGQEQAWMQAFESGQLDRDRTWRVWIITPDERLCDLCEPMDGEEVRVDEPWTTDDGAVQTPNDIHPMCRCTEGLVFHG